MGLVHFAAGYALGAKAGSQGFDEVIAAGRSIFSSPEFRDFVGALRWHVAHTLHEAARLVEGEQPETPVENLVDFVRSLMERREETLRRVTSAWQQAGPVEPRG